MKPLSIAFLGLLFWSQGLAGELADKPLSMFRDGEFQIVGYALFALLLAIGALMAATLQRRGHSGEAAVFASALALLLIVVATPSLNAAHETAAALLLLTLFIYYAGQLASVRSGLVFIHLLMPVALVPLLGIGYGPWQKGLIVYLLVVINIHWHLLPQLAQRQPRAAARGGSLKRRVVYLVEPGKAWGRQKVRGHTSFAT